MRTETFLFHLLRLVSPVLSTVLSMNIWWMNKWWNWAGVPYHSQCQIIYTTVLHRKEYRTVQSMNTASFINFPGLPWASLVAQMVKNPCPRQETWVQSLGQEDPLEKGITPYSSLLAWRTPWTEEPGGLQSMGLQRVRHYWAHAFNKYSLTTWYAAGPC